MSGELTPFLLGALDMNVAEIVGLAAVLYGALTFWRGRPSVRLRREYREALQPLGLPRNSISSRVTQLLDGETPTPMSEANWLADALGLPPDQPLTFVRPPDDTVIVDRGPRAASPPSLAAVADAYRKVAARLEKGALFGGSVAPLLSNEAQRARAVAAMLSSYRGVELSGSHAAELLEYVDGRRLTLMGASHQGEPVLRAQDLVTSYRPHRVAVRLPKDVAQRSEGDVGVRLVRDIRPEDRVIDLADGDALEIVQRLRQPKSFDGVLPRLIAWRAEVDRSSGRRSIHLCLGEATYAAVIMGHHLGTTSEDRQTRAASVGLLTLSAVPVTSCGHLVFVRRSATTGSHQRLLGPAINGNLEPEARHGISPDVDPHGVPDLRRALAREAREEIGLEVQVEDFVTMGLGLFTDHREAGTHVLLASCQLSLSRDELVRRMRHADPVEGAWENDLEVVTLRLPTTEGETTAAVDWLVGSPELTSHATMSGLAALALAMRDGTVLDRACASRGLAEPIPRPAALVEECTFTHRQAPGQGARWR